MIVTFLTASVSIRQFFLLLCIAAVIINIIQFRFIDENRRYEFQAIVRYDTSDIMEIAYLNSKSNRRAYSPFFPLATHAPGSRVILPQKGPYSKPEVKVRLITVGRASELLFIDYDPDRLLIEYDIVPYIVDTGHPSFRDLSWAIVMGNRTPEEFIFVQWIIPTTGERMDVLVETSLLPESIRMELGL